MSYPGTKAASVAAVDDRARRDELKEFLRSRREALPPDALGLVAGARRRTPGLRREEVAAAARVGVTWYTWLEQGRDISASHDALARIARALRLSPIDEAYLLCLGRAEAAAPAPAPPSYAIDPRVQAVLDATIVPMIVFGPAYDVLGYNRLADAIYGFSTATGRFASNLMWRLFVDPELRAFYVDWDDVAARSVGVLRALRARRPRDARFEALLAALRADSSEFTRMWNDRRVEGLDMTILRLRHARFGRFDISLVRFVLATEPDVIVSTLTARDKRATALFARLRRR